jgi:integrase
MKTRHRLIRRGIRGGAFYCVDTTTGKRTSLRTQSEEDAQEIVHAKNRAEHQPALNLQIAKAYLAGTDNGLTTRTWGDALKSIIDCKDGPTRDRWERVSTDAALTDLWPMVIVDTRGEALLRAMQDGTVSTNVYLRRIHNFCVDMNWLAWPLIPKRQWPAVRFKEKRAITWEEHLKIVAREKNPERKAFYMLAWHLGASQSDIAMLTADDIDWEKRVISYARKKTKVVALLHFGQKVEAILRELPTSGTLFPYLRQVRAGDRATEFKQRCQGLGILGVTLHSYRYAWAERARKCGYPERFAQEALGHNSKAVHRAYARRAQVKIPALEDYEKRDADPVNVPTPFVASFDLLGSLPLGVRDTTPTPQREQTR